MSDLSERRDREVERTAGRSIHASFATKVVGVSFVPAYPENLQVLNDVMRQSIERREPLAAVLRRNPANEYDANAIEVHVPSLGGDWGWIGHLTRPIAARLAPDMDAGIEWDAVVESVLINPDHPDRPGISIMCRQVVHE